MCTLANALFPNVDCAIVIAGGVILMLILGVVFHSYLKSHDTGVVQVDANLPDAVDTDDTTDEVPAEEEYTEEETEESDEGGEDEEESGYYNIEVILTMADDSLIKIFCDYIDGRSFSGGSATFYWDDSGMIEIEDGDGNEIETFDSDEKSIEWGISGVKSWEINGA
jgi:hypothetical protein